MWKRGHGLSASGKSPMKPDMGIWMKWCGPSTPWTRTVRASLQEAGLRYEWPETETTERRLVMNVERCGGDQYRVVIDGLRPHCAQVASTSETQGSAGQYDHRR